MRLSANLQGIHAAWQCRLFPALFFILFFWNSFSSAAPRLTGSCDGFIMTESHRKLLVLLLLLPNADDDDDNHHNEHNDDGDEATQDTRRN